MRLTALLAFAALASTLAADPLSKSLEIDFYREVPNRNIKGLAVRSDGRLLVGPTVRELPGSIPADLLWTFVRAGDDKAWLVGTGPDGKIFRVNTDVRGDYRADLAVDLDATHVFALCALDGDAFLAGTSPQGTLNLVRGGKLVASVALPADSIFAITLLPKDPGTALVATGNPGRIYRVDLAKFEAARDLRAREAANANPAAKEKTASASSAVPTTPSVGRLSTAELAQHGITLFGEIRDRNVRSLLALADGRVIAGSAPKGNVYAFPAAGGAPLLLLENREAETTDLLADADGSFYAAITFSGASGESRVNRPGPSPAVAAKPDAPQDDAAEAARAEKFSGRAQLVYFPAGGLPETVVARAGAAFYRLTWHEDAANRWILISGGEQGELLAYAPAERRSINLGAVASAQVNAILPSHTGTRGLFHLLRNNASGLSQLNFSESTDRSLETRKLDLGVASEIGQVRFARLDGAAAERVRVALRTSFGSDELEGWTEWTELKPTDGGWFAPGLRGRYVQLRVTWKFLLGAEPNIDKATLFHLPQNRRPQLNDFRIFPVNLGLVPAPDAAPAMPTMTLGQLLFPLPRETKDDSANKRKGGLLNSPVVPSPGAQIVYWTLADPDDDNLAATFSISPEGKNEWTDLAINTTESFVQFDVSHLPEGRYRSRLAVREQAPRPEAQRLSYTFETDYLTVDRTPPEIVAAKAEHLVGVWRITIDGRDAASLLEGAEVLLNNGPHSTLEQPLDGILDSRRETFVAEFPDAKAANATSAEITLYDKSGNSSATRVPLK